MASVKGSKDVYIDASGVTIHYYRWSPRGEPRAIVQLAHGLGEHAQRYRRAGGVSHPGGH